MTYGSIARVTLGPVADWFTRGVILLNLFGSTVAYITAMANLTSITIQNLSRKDPSIESTNAILNLLQQKWFVAVTIGSLVIFPFSLIENLNSLRFTSLMSLCWIVFLAVVVVWKYFEFCSYGYSPCLQEQFSTLPLFHLEWDALLGTVPLIVYAYTCHPNVLPGSYSNSLLTNAKYSLLPHLIQT